MIKRVGKNLAVRSDAVPDASVELERNGFAVLRGVFSDDEVLALRAELDEVFATSGPERGRTDEYRYEMLNRGPRSQEAVANPAVLAAIEPLLGDDCHVIANTAWRNPPEFAGGPWHCDAGPHVPRPKGIDWDDRIPYPVFAIGAHLLLQDCRRLDGPTAVVPGSHRSGRLPPLSQIDDPELTYDGRSPVLLEGAAGDVALFVVRRLAPWHAGGGRQRSLLPAGALRPARHRPTPAPHRRREPAVGRGHRTGDDHAPA